MTKEKVKPRPIEKTTKCLTTHFSKTDFRQQVIQDMFGVSRLSVLKKYFINQNKKCILKMLSGNMFEENIFFKHIFGNKTYVIINDVDCLATT